MTTGALGEGYIHARHPRNGGWGQLTAIGTVVALPMVLVGLAVRRHLVRGLTLGAVTGE